jgi:iron complex outermembrane receptor protein
MKSKHLIICTAVQAALAGMGNVYAAPGTNPTASSSSGIEEVIVTARKTEESIQVVPVSVTAFSGEALTRVAVNSIKDLRVPGLYVTRDTQLGNATFAIRAAKSGNGTGDTVTTYVGDVPMASTYAIAKMTYDMQAISVLKGPQGTLFGANSTGGAIIFTPNKPSDKFEGYVDVGVGDYNLQTYQGMVNIPVNDAVQLRIAGEVVNRDKGYVKNHLPVVTKVPGVTLSAEVLPNRHTELDNDKHESARLSLRLKPSADWEHNLSFEYFHEDDQPQPEIPVALLPPFTFGGFMGVNWQKYGGFILNDPKNVSFGGAPTWRKVKIQNTQWVANYEFNDRASFKSVLAYQDSDVNFSTDNDMTAWSVVNGYTQDKIKQWTWEPSVDWKSEDGRLRNKVGLFFSEKKYRRNNSYGLIGLPWDPTLPPTSLPAGFEPFVIPALNANLPTQGHQYHDRKFSSHAIYGQLSYDLTKELTATLGLRYSWDKGKYDTVDKKSSGSVNIPTIGQVFTNLPYVCTYGTGGGTDIPGYASYGSWTGLANTTGPGCQAQDSYKSQAPSFTFTLEDKYAENSMIYATLRGGYLLGGFNDQITVAQSALGLNPKFKPEKVIDFETGIKTDWELWNRPIRTNLAVFYGNYKDQQRFQNGNVNGVNLIGVMNAGSSTFYGMDLDVVYEPTDNLELTASWNHVETEYTSFKSFISGAATINGVTAVPSTLDLSGRQLAQAPKDVVNLSATVKWPLSSDVGKVSSTLTYYWTDKTESQDTPVQGCAVANAAGVCTSFPAILDFSVYDKIPAYDLWNFTTQWKGIMGSNFDANFWVKNLTDKKYAVYNSPQQLQFGYYTELRGEPRTFGANLRYNF